MYLHPYTKRKREPESTKIHTTVMICMFCHHTDPESPSPRLTIWKALIKAFQVWFLNHTYPET